MLLMSLDCAYLLILAQPSPANELVQVVTKLEYDRRNALRMQQLKRMQHPLSGYDSKRATGYVGIQNMGDTCYLNSLLQHLFSLAFFREVGSMRCWI